LEQAVSSTAQKMIENPINAWLAIVPILFICIVLGVLFFCYKLWSKSSGDSAKREERLSGIVDGTLKELTTIIGNLCTDLRSIKEDIDELRRGE
jgi:hypothetical protein